jgi:hypothetical protein
MARAIVRYSFGSEDVPVRNTVRAELESAGFQRIGTGSFEGKGLRNDLIGALTRALAAADEADTLDHVWIYLDEPG